MPYIKNKREEISGKVHTLSEEITSDGELNFAITQLLLNYVARKGLNYGVLNTVMGVLACVGNEFYRRKVVPYEQLKIRENGDIAEFD